MIKKLLFLVLNLILVGSLFVVRADPSEPNTVASGIQYVVWNEEYEVFDTFEFPEGDPFFVYGDGVLEDWGIINFFWDPEPGYEPDGTVEGYILLPAGQAERGDWMGVRFVESANGEDVRTVIFNLESNLPMGYAFQLIQNIDGIERVVWQTTGIEQGSYSIELDEGLSNYLDFRIKNIVPEIKAKGFSIPQIPIL